MSGLEVIGAVTGIVSAFAGVASWYQERQKNKKEEKDRKKQKKREKESAIQPVYKSVLQGAPMIQHQYDLYFAHFGRAFARGDETGRMALMQHWIAVQQHLIALLMSGTQGYNILSTVLAPTMNVVFKALSATKEGTVNALTQQWQRLKQAAPVQRPPQQPPKDSDPTICPGTPGHHDTVAHSNAAAPGDLGYKYVGKCEVCGWTDDITPQYIYVIRCMFWAKDSRQICDPCLLRKCHVPGARSEYRCPSCKVKFGDLMEVLSHIRLTHRYAEICPNGCHGGLEGCGYIHPLARWGDKDKMKMLQS